MFINSYQGDQVSGHVIVCDHCGTTMDANDFGGNKWVEHIHPNCHWELCDIDGSRESFTEYPNIYIE